MVWIGSERFSPGTVKKLHAHKVGPFEVMKRINYNACVLNLLEGFDISLIFNVEDLVAYKDSDFNPSNPCLMSLPKILLQRDLFYLHIQISYLMQ